MSEHHHIPLKSVKYLCISFVINMILSVIEIAGGIIAGSMALIGDALHNTSDALSILIAIIAFKIGHKKANRPYTYGFKRAEIIGGFVNLILLFISGIYLFAEGIERLILPHKIDGKLIIVISVLALIIDALTAKISHPHAHHNTNMKMVFVHNLADAFGSLGVILSGVCIVLFQLYFIDGVIAILISIYMIFQAVTSFAPIVRILMNAAPLGLDIERIENEILKIDGVQNVHHIHIFSISEDELALECHVKGQDLALIEQINTVMAQKFDIRHCNIQLEDKDCCHQCEL
ncbi:MAG: cation transporter [Alphaproteobacteria bacterium]|nr:cation transporter [Alphaproteobacteria bacterium]